MSALREKLREKFRTPQDALKALGLDESLLRRETDMKPTKFAATALQLTAHAVKPLLAKDAKIDLMPVFAGLTAKTFDKGKVRMALDAALKGKLAKDAEPNMGHVASMLDHIEHMSKPEVADESVSEAQHKAMGAAAGGNSNLGIPQSVGKEFTKADAGKSFDAEPLRQFLKEKGVGDEDIEKACDMLPKPDTEQDRGAAVAAGKNKDVGLDETEEEKRKREEEEAAAKDNMVTKDEMTTALRSAIAANTKTIRETERGIRRAFGEVKPWVGDMAMDDGIESATDVYRRAAKALGVANADKMHPDALLPVIQAQPRPGHAPRQAQDSALATDSAKDDFLKRFPGAEHIEVGDPGGTPAGY